MGKVTESKTFAAIALLLVVATIIFSVVAGLSQLSLIPLYRRFQPCYVAYAQAYEHGCYAQTRHLRHSLHHPFLYLFCGDLLRRLRALPSIMS